MHTSFRCLRKRLVWSVKFVASCYKFNNKVNDVTGALLVACYVDLASMGSAG